jgi:hypothetical protein
MARFEPLVTPDGDIIENFPTNLYELNATTGKFTIIVDLLMTTQTKANEWFLEETDINALITELGMKVSGDFKHKRVQIYKEIGFIDPYSTF